VAGRWVVLTALLAVLAGVQAAPRGSHPTEVSGLKSIAAWLKSSGRDGYLAAEVADAIGIPRAPSEEMLDAKQRGYRTGEVLRIAQVSADGKRDFMLFMAQQPDGEVHFYLSSVHDGLKSAHVSIPRRGMVVPMDRAEAETGFRFELSYWQDKVNLR
jgi:hypothetical protein